MPSSLSDLERLASSRIAIDDPTAREPHFPPESPEHTDCVDIASEDSFPASDAPSWTVVSGTGAAGEPR